MELSEVLATLAQRRSAAQREQKNVDPDIDEVYYWACFVECYFSPWGDLISGDEEVEGTGVALAELLDELQVEEKEIVTVTDSFQVPASQIAAVECEQMIIRQDSIAFMAIPKHSSVYVQTAEIPLATLEVAAKASKARN